MGSFWSPNIYWKTCLSTEDAAVRNEQVGLFVWTSDLKKLPVHLVKSQLEKVAGQEVRMLWD